MRIPFRQGIVQYKQPDIVQVSFPYVNLIADTASPVIFNIASGTTDYLHAEQENVTNAWGPIALSTNVWLYIDLNRRTAQRTFGTTTYEPVVGAVAPTSPANQQHWFDTSTNTMKVWSGASWTEVIRIFVCKLQSGSVPVSMSINSPLFSGTQVGNNDVVSAGYILTDTNGMPIKSTADKFITTEDNIRVQSLSSADVKVGNTVVEAIANQNLPAYTIVEFTDFGQVSPASAFVTTVQKQYGIVEQSHLIGEMVQVSTEGLITNLDWDWTSVGVNAYLYNDNAGTIVTAPVIPQQQPVAIVVDVHTIMLIMKVIVTNIPPSLASGTVAGITKLTVPPASSLNPVAVGDNDPRITAIAGKLNLTGGIMTGDLILHGDPSLNLEAATKQYVDNVVNGLSWINPINDTNLVDDSLNTPPGSPGNLIYIVGATPTGDWVGFEGHAMKHNGVVWSSLLGRPVQFGDRFGVSMRNVQFPSGGLTGHNNEIATVVSDVPGNITYNFTVPISSQAVLVDLEASAHFGHQYTFNGTNWVEFAGNVALSKLSDVTLTNPTAGQALTYNGVNDWINTTLSLVGLSDVTITTPTSGQALTYNGVEWVNSTPTTTLVGLSDVTITTPTSGQALTYNGVEWVNSTPTTTLVGLSDVTITTPISGQALTYNGVEWVNSTPASTLDSLSDVIVTNPTMGQGLSFDGTNWINGNVFIPNTYKIWGAGDNGFGALADGTITTRNVWTSEQSNTKWKNTQVGGGWEFVAAIKEDGTLWTWGRNSHYQLGDGTNFNRSSPVQVGTDIDWKIISRSSSANHILAIKNNGTLWAWGDAYYGELGNGIFGSGQRVSSPIQIGTLTNWSTVSCGYGNSAAIKADGTLWMCGYNRHGQLGSGDTVNKSVLTQVGTLTDWKQVACAYSFTAAIKTDGTLWMCGYNAFGELGDGTTVYKSSPIQVGSLTNWKQVSAERNHVGAIKTDGTLWMWGKNTNGEIGDGTFVHKSSPVQIGSLTNWASVSCGYSVTTAIKTDGTLWMWGNNGYGQFGNGTNTHQSSPIQIGQFSTWSQVHQSGNATIILGERVFVQGVDVSGGTTGLTTSGGPISTAGTITLAGTLNIANGGTGAISAINALNNLLPTQTGNSGKFLTTNGSTPSWGTVATGGGGGAALPPSGGIPDQALTMNAFTPAWTPSVTISPIKNMWLFGGNTGGMLGDNTIVNKSSPIQLGTATTWMQASVGQSWTLAISQNGTLWAWGQNSAGQLGTGNTTPRSSPVQIGALTNWKQVAAEYNSSHAIKTDGTLWGWGNNTHGQIGDGTITQRSSPVQIGTLTNWSQLACGYHHSVAVKTDGTLWAWGYNSSGQLGDGTQVHRSSPVQIGALTNWAFVAGGTYYTMAIKTDGTLWAWGDNTFGKLGDGTSTAKSSPVQIGTLKDWKQVNCGHYHTTAIKTNGTLWKWGQNTDGQLGDNTVAHKSSPIQVGALTTWKYIGGGLNHTAAVKTDGTLWTWGMNDVGQLGDGTITKRSSPIQVGSLTTWDSLALSFYSSTTLAMQSFISGAATTATPGTLAVRDANGDIYANNFISSSDIVLKENIRDIETPEELVASLLGHRFKMIASQEESFGFIAQEVEKVLPELVHQHGETKSVNYVAVIGILVEAFKRLKNRVTTLEGK